MAVRRSPGRPSDKPSWRRPRGAVVAVAAGSYVEDVLIQNGAVRLVGVCPDKAEIVGTANGIAAVFIREGADGTEVRGLGIRGAVNGIALSGSEGVVIDRVWVHGTAERGIDVEGVLGPTSVSIAGLLVEQTHDVGVFVMGAVATMDASVVRGTLPRTQDKSRGRGVQIQLSCSTTECDAALRANVTVRRSVVEQNHDIGLIVSGGRDDRGHRRPRHAPSAFLRRLRPRCRSEPSCVFGICDPAARANATFRGSVVEQNYDFGMFVMGSDVIVESSVIRDTQPRAYDQDFGEGLDVQLACTEQGVCFPETKLTALVRGSVVQQNHYLNVIVVSSDERRSRAR